METWSAKPQLRMLLDHLATITDTRQSWKVAYSPREVLFLVVCGTIAGGDDYEDIVDWGEAHLWLLRGFAEFYHGIPCADWLRVVMNRIDPDLFATCFSSCVAECWPNRPGLVAIDGKTSRRSHDRKRGQKALHLVSAFATTKRLVLGQEAVDEKSNEITARAVTTLRAVSTTCHSKREIGAALVTCTIGWALTEGIALSTA